jgi:hypothetical protein
MADQMDRPLARLEALTAQARAMAARARRRVRQSDEVIARSLGRLHESRLAAQRLQDVIRMVKRRRQDPRAELRGQSRDLR